MFEYNWSSTSHIYEEKEKFMELYESEIQALKLETNVTTDVTGIETVKIKIINGKTENDLTTENVLYAPNVRIDLLWLKIITEKEFKFVQEIRICGETQWKTNCTENG